MKFHGITLQEGSKVYNLTVAAGTTFPSSPDEGELFFRNDTAVNVKGLYIYVGGNWDRISSTDTSTVQTGVTLPVLANAGDLFYKNSNDGLEGLYVFNDSSWTSVAGGSNGLPTGGTAGYSLVKNSNTDFDVTWAARAAVGANTDITSLSGITGGISTVDNIDFDVNAAPSNAVGRLQWNNGDGTLEFGLKGGNTVLQVGQEQVQRIFNNTGATLSDGQVVVITGSQGQRLTVAKASSSSESLSSTTIGVVTETITAGNEGFITTFGLVRNLDTSAFAEGAALWLGSTAGTLTTTKPFAPQHAVLVGFCVRQHATSGSIFVKVQNGYELDELHDVRISSPQDNDSLIRDAANGYWKNVPSSTIVATGLPSQLGQNSKFLTTNGSNLSWSTVPPAGSNTQIQFNNNGVFGASSKFTWDDSVSKLSLTNTSDLAFLQANGHLSIGTQGSTGGNRGDLTLEVFSTTINDGGHISLAAGTSLMSSSSGGSVNIYAGNGTDVGGGIYIGSGGGAINGEIAFSIAGTNHYIITSNGALALGPSSSSAYTGTAGQVITSTGSTGAPVWADALSNVGTAGTYGSASAVPVFTTDAKGRVTSVTPTDIQIAESQITDGSILARVGSNETISGTWTFTHPISGAEPVNGSDLTTKTYVDNIALGLDVKASVRAATTGNITLSGTQTVDGVILIAGNRVLVKNQTNGAENGIYVVSSGAWARSTDADNTPSGEVTSGLFTFVEEGTANNNSGWILTTDGAITLGTTILTFVQFSGGAMVNAGTGISIDGSTINNTGVLSVVAGSGIAVSGGTGNVTVSADLSTGTPRVAITSTNEVTLTSTDDPLRIGSLSDVNMAVDTNEIQTRNNGAASDLFLNPHGGKVTIGSSIAASPLRVTSSTVDTTILADAYGSLNASYVTRKAGGTEAVPTATADATIIGTFGSRGHTGTTFSTISQAAMVLKTTEVWSDTGNGTKISFYTTPNAGVTRKLRLELGQDGIVAYNNSEIATFTIGNDYAITAYGSVIVNPTAGNAGLEIGARGRVNTPFIDLHSGATDVDYDVRFYSSGGTGSAGGGSLYVDAASTVFTNKIVVVDSFDINGTGPAAQQQGLYMAQFDGTVGATGNPTFTAAVCAQIDTGGARSIALSVDGSGYLYGFRSHSNAGTYTWQSKTRQADAITTAPDASIATGSITTTSTSITNLDTLSISAYRSAKYEIQITTSTAVHVTEVRIFHDGTNAYHVEYGTSASGSALGVFTTDIFSGLLRLRFTAASTTSTVVKFYRTALTV